MMEVVEKCVSLRSCFVLFVHQGIVTEASEINSDSSVNFSDFFLRVSSSMTQDV
jgi:hypothetical protein